MTLWEIDNVIVFHLSKLWKAKFSMLCDVIILVRQQGKFEVDHSWEWKGLTGLLLPKRQAPLNWPVPLFCQVWTRQTSSATRSSAVSSPVPAASSPPSAPSKRPPSGDPHPWSSPPAWWTLNCRRSINHTCSPFRPARLWRWTLSTFRARITPANRSIWRTWSRTWCWPTCRTTCWSSLPSCSTNPQTPVAWEAGVPARFSKGRSGGSLSQWRRFIPPGTWGRKAFYFSVLFLFWYSISCFNPFMPKFHSPNL